MCGICGIFSLEGPLDPVLAAALPGMMDAIRHRGPDASGSYTDGAAALGHRRLSIIDRAGGEQPMTNEDGTLRVVFNGEIYNHRDLRAELRASGHVFATRSDTEVILHGYEQWGERCVERFEGMFAFALYDARRRSLFLARDRLGKKPLFFAALGGALHFASELKAIRASPRFDGALDPSVLEGYLSLGYVVAPDTMYRAVRKLEPGHWLRASAGRIEVRRYWDVLDFDSDTREPGALAGELDRLLSHAVLERLESEVPLGAFLSGGIDSGLVVSYMAEALGSGVTTCSVGFDAGGHNELAAARLTARRHGTRHHETIVEPRCDEVLDAIVDAFDEPFADSSAVPTYHVSRIARRSVTVALSGDGGDEAFGGYDFRYIPHALEERARSVFRGRAGRRAASWLGAVWPRSPRLPRPLRLASLLENLGDDAANAYYRDLCFMKPHAVRALLGDGGGRSEPRGGKVHEAVTAAYRRCPSRSAVQRAQYADLMVYLPNDVLVKVDRMSMLHGLEVRCPLLDRRVIEFAFRIPTAAKMPRWRPKALLRRVARSRLPRELLRLPKRGFTAPIGAWIAGPLAPRFREGTLSGTGALGGFVDLAHARRLFEEHCASRADHSYALFALHSLSRFLSNSARTGSRHDYSPRTTSNAGKYLA